MGWFIFSFDKPLFLVQVDPLKLWPSIIVTIIIFIIQLLTNYTLEPLAKYLTDYKIAHEIPEWLISNPRTLSSIREQNLKNGATGYKKQIHDKSNHVILTESQQTEIISIIKTSSKKDSKKVLNHASDLKLSQIQTRQLKTYFNLVKEYDIHKSKFLESTFKVLCVLPISLYGTYVVYFKHDFFINHWKQWIHYADDTTNWEPCNFNLSQEPLIQIYDNAMYYYYIVSLGYHLNRALSQFHNPARKDFWALLIHHWATLILIVFSWTAGKARVGCVTLAIHESSDIFLESAKILGYCSLYWVADILFVFFFLSWIIFRMFFFCQKLLWVVYYCGSDAMWLGNHPLLYGHICIGFLYVLEGLHIYWFRLIMKIVINLITGGRIVDVRSDHDKSDEDTEKDKIE